MGALTRNECLGLGAARAGARLHAMNLEQRILPHVMCDRCGAAAHA